MAAHFTPAFFTYLRALKAHNTRAWFQANRDRYVADVEAPMLRFIADLTTPLRAISPAFVVDPRRLGGSMYRIHRDTRFSADKSPYKTHIAAHFRHEQKKTAPSVPGFYLHLAAGNSMGGGGIYHPDMPTLTRIRHGIVEHARGWATVKHTGLVIEGERLTRAPAGFDAAHPAIDDLRRKSFYAMTVFPQAEVCAEDFLERYIESCRRVAPLVAFLTKSLGWRW